MKCHEFMQAWEEMEPGTVLPWHLRDHLRDCGPCSRELARIESALSAWRSEEAAIGPSRDREAFLDARVMAAVRLGSPPRRTVGLGKWAIAGAFLAVSGVLMPFAHRLEGLGSVLGDDLLFPLALVLGTLLAIFGFIFIGSHFEELSGELEQRRESSREAALHRP